MQKRGGVREKNLNKEGSELLQSKANTHAGRSRNAKSTNKASVGPAVTKPRGQKLGGTSKTATSDAAAVPRHDEASVLPSTTSRRKRKDVSNTNTRVVLDLLSN